MFTNMVKPVIICKQPFSINIYVYYKKAVSLRETAFFKCVKADGMRIFRILTISLLNDLIQILKTCGDFVIRYLMILELA